MFNKGQLFRFFPSRIRPLVSLFQMPTGIRQYVNSHAWPVHFSLRSLTAPAQPATKHGLLNNLMDLIWKETTTLAGLCCHVSALPLSHGLNASTEGQNPVCPFTFPD